MIPVINQYGREYTQIPEKTRIGCRAIIIENGKILLSHELNTYAKMYLIPGGGLEDNETHAECCAREVLEETGYIVRIGKQLCTVNEHYKNTLFISHYFICDIIGEGKPNLTETEIEHGVVPEWVDYNDSLRIFGEYEKYSEIDEEIEGQYKREYAVLCEYGFMRNSIEKE